MIILIGIPACILTFMFMSKWNKALKELSEFFEYYENIYKTKSLSKTKKVEAIIRAEELEIEKLEKKLKEYDN